MAKVIGPLFSQEASGQFGKSVVFSRRRGQNIVRGYAIPSNPMTPDQIIVRVAMAATGIICRRVRATNWEYAGQAETFIEFYAARTRTGEVWNSAYVRELQGPGRANYIATLAQWEALDQATQDGWTAEAEGSVGGLTDYVRGTDTVEAGFMLFLAEKTIADAGYGDPFDPSTPVTLVAG